jgi:hypothetical protein
VPSRLLARLSLALALVAAGGCVSAPPLDRVLDVPAPAPAIRFGVDTFAFRNESRSKNRGKPDLYANWCFVLVRAVTQFHRFARFDPSAAPLTDEAYVARVRQVTAHEPWQAPLAPGDRIVIPGYASLHDLSRAREGAVKAGLGGRFWTWIHWTNWRVAFPMPAGEQEGVARETLAELQAGRPVQWLVTNFPKMEMNHTLLVYDYRARSGVVDFTVYDPNDPTAPGLVQYDVVHRRFWSTRLYDTSVGPMRAFRMYYRPLL